MVRGTVCFSHVVLGDYIIHDQMQMGRNACNAPSANTNFSETVIVSTCIKMK